jgi:hypothetical protein
MKQRDVGVPGGLEVVNEEVDTPINERSARLGPDWHPKPGDLAWIGNDRNWDDVFRDLLNLVHKPLHLLQGWLRTK